MKTKTKLLIIGLLTLETVLFCTSCKKKTVEPQTNNVQQVDSIPTNDTLPKSFHLFYQYSGTNFKIYRYKNGVLFFQDYFTAKKNDVLKVEVNQTALGTGQIFVGIADSSNNFLSTNSGFNFAIATYTVQ